MINVSEEFRATMRERTDFTAAATITLADDTQYDLTAADFTVSNNDIMDAAGVQSFPLGVTIGRSIQIELMNDGDRFLGVDFYGAKIRLFLNFKLSETTERIPMGVFTVLTPETYGATVIITASDESYKTDRPYATGLSYPATLSAMFREACEQSGIPYSAADFPNSGITVLSPPAGNYTCRQIIGYIAMLAGGNARVNRNGEMEILSYNKEKLNTGGADHQLADWINLKTELNDITITGLQTTYNVVDNEGNSYNHTLLYGEEGYILSIDNPLMEGQEETAVALIGTRIIGLTFRKFSGDYIGYPIAEFMDTAAITDVKGNVYYSVLTDITFSFFGITNFFNSAESGIASQSTYQSSTAKAVAEARKIVNVEKSAREAAVSGLTEKLQNASGMYTTEELQEDGSTVTYLHDKPTLEESANVVKITSEAVAVSTDGGVTYPYGFELTGDLITRLISAVGVNADWVYIESRSVTDVLENTYTKEETDAQIKGSSDTLNEKIDDSSSALRNETAVIKERITTLETNSDAISIRIQDIIDNGVNRVVTSTGYRFDANGLYVSRSGEEIGTRVDNTGLYVEKNGEAVLKANSYGVEAENITVKTYLTVGKNSRFEDYQGDRTGCFYIGAD